MVSVTQSVKITRAPEDVFAFVSNYENDVAWRDGVIEMNQWPPEPTQVGTTTREVLKSFGMEVETTAEITGCEPGRRVEFRSLSGPVPVTGYRLVEQDGDSASFTYHLALEPTGVYRMLAPLMGRTFKQRVNRDLDRLKTLLESA